MPHNDPKVRKRIYRMELGAYILIVAVALYGFWLIGKQQDATRQSQKCTEEFLADTVSTLSERTSFTSDVQKADEAQNDAFLKLVQYSLISPEKQNPDKARKIVEDYNKKLSAYLSALDKANQARENNPYPLRDEYRQCLKESDNE